MQVGRARFEQDRGIAIHDISLAPPQNAGESGPLVSIEEMYLAGKIRMEELISGDPHVERIIIRRAGCTRSAKRMGNGTLRRCFRCRVLVTAS